MDSILEASKDKKGVRQIQQALLLFIIILLCGCYQSHQFDIAYNMDLKLAWLDAQPDAPSIPLNQIEFQTVDSSHYFAFQSNSQLLLKINFNEVAFAPQNKEFTLVISPGDLQQVAYYQEQPSTQSIELMRAQSKYQSYGDVFLSGQQFAFNIDQEDLFNNHYLLIHSDIPASISVSLYDYQGFLRQEINNNQQSTFLIALLLAVAIFCLIVYFFRHDKKLFILAGFTLTSLWAVLWQSKMINYLPWLVWPLIGSNSEMFYELLAGVMAFALVFNLTNPMYQKKWLIQLFIGCTLVQIGLLFYISMANPENAAFAFTTIHQTFNAILLIMYLVLWVILITTEPKYFQQQKSFVVAWIIIMVGLVLQKYQVFFPHTEINWIEHVYETSLLSGMLIMAIALSNNKSFTISAQESIEVTTKPSNKSVFKHQLISQFQHEMNKLADNTTLSEEEIAEKTNIKFHLLLTQAYPIKNSLILTETEIEGICTTGIDAPDIAFLKQLATEFLQNSNHQDGMQKLIGMAGDKQNNVLFVPLSQVTDQKVLFILTLKTHETLKAQTLTEIRAFCEDAYAQLCVAKNTILSSMATKLDSLTQCYNRESIEAIIKHSLDQKKLTTLAFIDVDHLQELSVQQGIAKTNEMLIQLAIILKAQLAPTAKIGRIGSDEFLVVFNGYNIHTCLEKLESFNHELSKHSTSKIEATMTCSTGVAESRMNETVRSLIKKAKTAMLHAKKQGGNQITLYEVDM